MRTRVEISSDVETVTKELRRLQPDETVEHSHLLRLLRLSKRTDEYYRIVKVARKRVEREDGIAVRVVNTIGYKRLNNTDAAQLISRSTTNRMTRSRIAMALARWR